MPSLLLLYVDIVHLLNIANKFVSSCNPSGDYTPTDTPIIEIDHKIF